MHNAAQLKHYTGANVEQYLTIFPGINSEQAKNNWHHLNAYKTFKLNSGDNLSKHSARGKQFVGFNCNFQRYVLCRQAIA